MGTISPWVPVTTRGTYPASVGQQAVSYLARASFLAGGQTFKKKAAVPLKDCELNTPARNQPRSPSPLTHSCRPPRVNQALHYTLCPEALTSAISSFRTCALMTLRKYPVLSLLEQRYIPYTEHAQEGACPYMHLPLWTSSSMNSHIERK